jgi:mono/diheme cytochrome c family protein
MENAVTPRSVLFVFASALALSLLAQAPAPKKASAHDTPAASGAEMYQSYCASCHGPRGLGAGPVAQYLKTPVPDLTTLTRQNKGVFPTQRVAQVIRGEVDVKTHGIREMAVWGPFFLSQKNTQEAVVQARVVNLSSYLESLQVK